MDWSFLIPGDDNLVTDDGCRYWSTGAIYCKENIYWASVVFNNYEGNEHGAVDGLAGEFCEDDQNDSEDFPCFQWRFAFFALLSSMLNKALVRLLLHSWLAVLPINKAALHALEDGCFAIEALDRSVSS